MRVKVLQMYFVCKSTYIHDMCVIVAVMAGAARRETTLTSPRAPDLMYYIQGPARVHSVTKLFVLIFFYYLYRYHIYSLCREELVA